MSGMAKFWQEAEKLTDELAAAKEERLAAKKANDLAAFEAAKERLEAAGQALREFRRYWREIGAYLDDVSQEMAEAEGAPVAVRPKPAGATARAGGDS